MLHWEFEHHASDHRQFWEWRALRSDGRVYRRSERTFPSFMKAFEDAAHHGFDRDRHPWGLATPTYRPARANPVISRRRQRGRLALKKRTAELTGA
jgi:hypothetical protein